MIISSQRYRDEDTVDAKSAAKDYVVTLSPEFEYEGQTYQVVTDGHHSLSAAIQDGVEPEYVIDTTHDAFGLMDRPEMMLEALWIDSDWHDPITGKTIW